MLGIGSFASSTEILCLVHVSRPGIRKASVCVLCIWSSEFSVAICVLCIGVVRYLYLVHWVFQLLRPLCYMSQTHTGYFIGLQSFSCVCFLCLLVMSLRASWRRAAGPGASSWRRSQQREAAQEGQHAPSQPRAVYRAESPIAEAVRVVAARERQGAIRPDVPQGKKEVRRSVRYYNVISTGMVRFGLKPWVRERSAQTVGADCC